MPGESAFVREDEWRAAVQCGAVAGQSVNYFVGSAYKGHEPFSGGRSAILLHPSQAAERETKDSSTDLRAARTSPKDTQ